MITRYDIMNKQIDKTTGIEYPDCFSFNFNNFQISHFHKHVLVKEENTIRPDIFFYKESGSNDMEDIILWYNGISCRREMKAGDKLNFPDREDLNKFYIKKRKQNK